MELPDILLTLTHRNEGSQGSSVYDIFSCLCFACWSQHLTFTRRTNIFLIVITRKVYSLPNTGWFQLSTFNSTRHLNIHQMTTQCENRTEQIQIIITQSHQNKPKKKKKVTKFVLALFCCLFHTAV